MRDGGATGDASAPDASMLDASAPDASAPDASAPDASVGDASVGDASVGDASAPDAGIELPCLPLPTTETREQTGPLDLRWLPPMGPSCPSALGAAPLEFAAVRFCNASDTAVGLSIVVPASVGWLPDGLERPIAALYEGSTVPADATECLVLRSWAPEPDPLATTVPAHGSVVLMIGESAARDAGQFYFFYSAPGVP